MFGRDILTWCGELSFKVQCTEEHGFSPAAVCLECIGNAVFQSLRNTVT